MSQESVAMWLTAILGMTCVALFLGVGVTHSKYWHALPKTFRLGYVLCGLGLGVQCYRTLYFLNYGHYPVDLFFPLWALKDIGFCLMTFSMCHMALAIERETKP